jgi:signal transduction histidine kinase
VLLVDDRPANLLALEALLEPLGHRLVRAQSGRAAIARVEAETFAVALMDVQMPELDGFQTTHELRRLPRGRDLPIIFITAIYGELRHALRGYSLGAFDYLQKPFEPDLLRAKVSAFAELYLRGERLAHEESARRAAELATRARDEFLAMVSHELRTPLAALIGWAELEAAGRLDVAQAQHAHQAILRCARAQAQLVEDLLDVSRIAAGKLALVSRPFRLGEVMRNAAELMRPVANERHVELRVAGDDAPREIKGDPERLQQVVLNLLSNAVKFSRPGGAVELSLEQAADHVRIRVRDHGIGIAPGFLPRLFERFSQAEPRGHGGLGLGLAIARHIVEQHGGTISAESAGQDQGAAFTVTLPG